MLEDDIMFRKMFRNSDTYPPTLILLESTPHSVSQQEPLMKQKTFLLSPNFILFAYNHQNIGNVSFKKKIIFSFAYFIVYIFFTGLKNVRLSKISTNLFLIKLESSMK